jgi:CubicO group peptidase (beta-lactamase class C family)
MSTSPGLREQLTRLMEAREIPGLQAVVLRHGEIVASETLGMANLEHDVAVTRESVFSINSMAKAFTGIALMQLVESGDLDLDAPVARYLDALPGAWQPITIRQLATLTSGLPEIMAYGADSSVGLVAEDEEAAWAVVHAAPMEFEPGRGYNYVQTNYALLGKVIDRLSGQPFVDFITERQFDVAGMPRTRYANDHDLIPHRADTYMSIDASGEPTGRIDKSRLDWPHLLRTAAGLHSTAEDLAAWMSALESGALLSAASRDTMWTPVPAHDGSSGLWGIGWLVFERPQGLVPAPGGGGKAQIVRYPDGLTLIVLTNLLGAFPEHVAVAHGKPIDLHFVDDLLPYCPH